MQKEKIETSEDNFLTSPETKKSSDLPRIKKRYDTEHCIEISEDDFDQWFNTSLKAIKSSDSPEMERIKKLYTEHIKKLYDTIRFIDTNKETEYYEYIQKHFVDSDALNEKSLFCILLLNYLLDANTIFGRKNFSIKNEKGRFELLDKQLKIADNIFRGVYELVKNIKHHAKVNIGGKWEKTDGNLIIKFKKKDKLVTDKKNSNLWGKYLQYLADNQVGANLFLHISLADNGKRGIIETTLDYMSEERNYRNIPETIKKPDRIEINRRLELIKSVDKSEKEKRSEERKLLFDMYFSHSNSFLKRQFNQALKGEGLYKFTQFLSNNNGFLNVQTRSYLQNSPIGFSLFGTPEEPEPALLQSDLFEHSDYHIILPLQKLMSEKIEQNNQDQESNEKPQIEIVGRELSGSVYEKMLSLERTEENVFKFNIDDRPNVSCFEYKLEHKTDKKTDISVYSLCSFDRDNIGYVDTDPLRRLTWELFDPARNKSYNPDKKEVIVIRNLPEDAFEELLTSYKIYGNDNELSFFKNKILLLLTNKDEERSNANRGIFIVSDDNRETCLKINKYISQNNTNFSVMPRYMIEEDITEEEIENFNNILSQYLPFDNGQLIELDVFEYIDDQKTTLFEDKTKKQLKKSIDALEDDIVGYNWEETHLKIGSKLHLRDFVYGKKMFQRSDKASTFAFLLANNIFDNIKETIVENTLGKKIIYTLVGYGYYSELMVSRTCDFVKKLFELNDITSQRAEIEYVIIKDEDNIKFSRFFYNLKNRKNTLEKLLIIVPISSTLTTCLKIENKFNKILKKKLEDDSKKETDKEYSSYKRDDFEIIGPFYTTIVVSDDIELKDLPKAFDDKNNVVRFVWEKEGTQNKKIATKNREINNEKRKNLFNIYIESKWQLPYNCEYCFPPIPVQERPIFVTDKVSVTPSLIFKPSEWYKKGDKKIEYNEPYFKFEGDNSEEGKKTPLPILDKIKWAHYEGEGSKHFNFYINYLDFVENNERCEHNEDSRLKQWTDRIKENFKKDKNKRILLIAPDKAENGKFIHIINREIFGDRASVIRFDKHSDHYLNFGKFFSKDIEQAESIYFVDNLMLSGKTFFSIDEILKTTQQNKGEKDKRKIKGIFSLINRMDYSCFNAVVDKLQSNNMDYSCFNALIDKLQDNNIDWDCINGLIDKIKNNNAEKDKLPNLYSFLQLNVLESSIIPCPLCEEEKKYEELKKTASLDCIKEYFLKKEKPNFEKISREGLLEGDSSYQPFQKRKNNTLLQAAIIHFLNKAAILKEPFIKRLQKTGLPDWSDSKKYTEYIDFNGFVKKFRKFIIEQKQCCFEFKVISDLKFKSNIIKMLSGQFGKKYRGIYIAVFYWVLCELIVATRTVLGEKYKYYGKYNILTRKKNLKNLTDFSILAPGSFSTATKKEIKEFTDKTNYLRLLIKYASSLNIAYLLHKDFLAAINTFVNRIEKTKNEIQTRIESFGDNKFKENFKNNRYAFDEFKIFCAAHISRSLYENEQRAIQFEESLNELYNNKDIVEADKTFLELLLLENTSIIRQTLKRLNEEEITENLQVGNPLLVDYCRFSKKTGKIQDEIEMIKKINSANELQRNLSKDNKNDDDNLEKIADKENHNLKKIAEIVGCNAQSGGGILLYKYQDIDKNTKAENDCVIGRYGEDISLLGYFEDNAEPDSFTANFLEGITYLSGTDDDKKNKTKKAKYKWTSYALYKHKEDNNEWKGQDGKTEITIEGEDKPKKFSDFSDIKILPNKANRILFIRISSYDGEDLKGEAVCVFYDNDFYDSDTGAERRYSVCDTRFIHVLRNNISGYLKSRYDTDKFRALVEEQNKTLYAITLNHGIGIYKGAINYYLDNVPDSENKEYLKTAIDYLLNKTHLAYTAFTLSSDDLKEFTLNEIIQEIKNSWLRILRFHHDKLDFFDTDDKVAEYVTLIDEVSETDKQIPFKSKAMFIKEFVFELIYNIRKHIIKHNYDHISVDNKVEITMSYDKDTHCFVCSNNFCDLVSVPSLAKNKNDGLSLINSALKRVEVGKLTIKIENDLFKVYIPLKN